MYLIIHFFLKNLFLYEDKIQWDDGVVFIYFILFFSLYTGRVLDAERQNVPDSFSSYSNFFFFLFLAKPKPLLVITLLENDPATRARGSGGVFCFFLP